MPEIASDEIQRLFVGVPVPEKTSLSIVRQLPASLPGRQSPLSNWHFTLRFLGDAGSGIRDRLIEQLNAVRLGAAFPISFDRLGAFPNSRRARVLWLGVANGRERLESLAAKVESAARQAGFDPEARRFSAHLTLSRMRSPESVADIVARSRPVDAEMRVDEVILYSSRTGGPHSVYTVVQTFPLG
jgi:RNA 2',3'-cyclic 3'-phosphodiesterase